MKIDRCAVCSSYDPIRSYCNRHLRGIEHILSCSADGDPTKIKKETGEVFGKKYETPTEGQRKILVDLLKNLRKSVMYSNPSGEYERGFFQGWTTACNAVLSAIGVDPLLKD